MGLIINKAMEEMQLGDLLYRLGLLPPEETNSIHLPHETYRLPVFTGGPVEPGRGFVLHSLVHDLVQGRGPQRLLLALGYAGWAPGQLEAELTQNAWLTCPADMEIIFTLPPEERYAAALMKIGIDPGSLSSTAGHA